MAQSGPISSGKSGRISEKMATNNPLNSRGFWALKSAVFKEESGTQKERG